jgi:hypothetical protein
VNSAGARLVLRLGAVLKRVEHFEVRFEEPLRIDGTAFEELKHDEGIVRLDLPSLLLLSQHRQVSHRVLPKPAQVLRPDGSFVEALA